MRWRFLDSGAADGVTNMATDVALLDHARRTGETTFRVYAWSRPTLSLGRHERARGLFAAEALEADGVEVVRRPTGGRALLHHREVTYSVTAPIEAASPRESYEAINFLLLDALAALGVSATEARPTQRPLRPEGAACFAEPGAGELVVDGAKLVGSAQLREDGALLQHGSILLADDQPWIARLRSRSTTPAAQRRPDQVPEAPRAIAGAATLESTLGRPVAYVEVRDALRAALTTRTARVDVVDPSSLQRDLARLQIAFADPGWTWRR